METFIGYCVVSRNVSENPYRHTQSRYITYFVAVRPLIRAVRVDSSLHFTQRTVGLQRFIEV